MEDANKKIYTIWLAGRRRTDTFEAAMWLGKIQGSSFQEACDNFFSSPEDKIYYSSKELTYNGTKLFDNEADASHKE